MDISINDLLEWLYSKGVLVPQWVAVDEVVRRDLSSLLETEGSVATDNPDVLKLLNVRQVSYRGARVLLFAFMVDNALNQKTLFGRYKIPFVDALNNIVCAWEKMNAHIGNMAVDLVQRIKYEYAHVKSDISAQEMLCNSMEKRIIEYRQRAAQCEHAFAEACHQWGINGAGPHDLRAELQVLSALLPEWLSKIEDTSRTELKHCLDYYLSFIHVKETILKVNALASKSSEISIPRLFPVTQSILDGDHTPRSLNIEDICSRRQELLNELTELHSFFSMRLAELTDFEELQFSCASAFISAREHFPVLNSSPVEIRKLAQSIMFIIDQLTDSRIVNICYIAVSPEERERVESSLLALNEKTERLLCEQTDAEQRRYDAKFKIKELNKREEKIKAASETLKNELEIFLSRVLSCDISICISSQIA